VSAPVAPAPPRPRRNILVLLAAIFLIAGGEQLWSAFVPKYLQALGASVVAVSAYGVGKDLLDAIYQYPGGVMTARFGARTSLVLFNALALAGYVVVAAARSWWVVIAALPLVMAWQSFSLPATFSIVGDSLPRAERSTAFAWQSIIRRVPIAVAPVAGGALLSAYGVIAGVRIAIFIGIALALTAAVIQWFAYHADASKPLALSESLAGIGELHPLLKRLLAADILVRFGQGIAEIFVVLYATNVLGAPASAFGWLVGLAMLTSIAVYLPAARRADAGGREPWVTATYLFFAAFPLSLCFTRSAMLLPIAFALMGLREIGEPPRKALIVDLARSGRKAVDVGAYYFVRGLAVFPASFVGALLWRVEPRLTFAAAAAVALGGAIAFYVFVQRAPAAIKSSA
jgi:MFS family permease